MLQTEEEYDAALNRADAIFHAQPGSAGGDELALLLLVIKAYEDEHHPLLPPNPIETIKLTMAEKGIKAADLTRWIGVSKGYVSQILNEKKRSRPV